MGGICGRTAAVRAAIVEKAGAASCAEVDAAALEALTGTLDVSDAGLAAIAVDDLDGLTGLTGLDLSGNGLAALPEYAFDELDASSVGSILPTTGWRRYPRAALRQDSLANDNVTSLDLSGNRITALSFPVLVQFQSLVALDLSRNEIAEVVRGLVRMCLSLAGTELARLSLRANRLVTLPDGEFAGLVALTDLDLGDNPGSAGFVPAVAAAADVAEAGTGQTVTLEASVTGAWTSGADSNVSLAWTQVSGPPVALSNPGRARTTFTAPDEDATLVFRASATGRGTAASGSGTVSVKVTPAPVAESIAIVSSPQDGAAYGEGEAIEFQVTFSQPVAVTGEPAIWIEVGGSAKRALHAPGASGGRLAVFAYTVAAADEDDNGVGTCTTSVNSGCDGEIEIDAGEAIVSAATGLDADPAHPELGAQSAHKVDGSTTALTGGICARTPEVRTTILSHLAFNGVDVADCSAVGAAELARLTYLRVYNNTLVSLKADDFEGLVNVRAVGVRSFELQSLPAGLLDSLPELSSFGAEARDSVNNLRETRLRTVPSGLFDNNPKLRSVSLRKAEPLTSLPPGLFDHNPELHTVLLKGSGLTDLPDGVLRQQPAAEIKHGFQGRQRGRVREPDPAGRGRGGGPDGLRRRHGHARCGREREPGVRGVHLAHVAPERHQRPRGDDRAGPDGGPPPGPGGHGAAAAGGGAHRARVHGPGGAALVLGPLRRGHGHGHGAAARLRRARRGAVAPARGRHLPAGRADRGGGALERGGVGDGGAVARASDRGRDPRGALAGAPRRGAHDGLRLHGGGGGSRDGGLAELSGER